MGREGDRGEKERTSVHITKLRLGQPSRLSTSPQKTTNLEEPLIANRDPLE